MSLIIEDGTGVTDANAYITLAEFKAFATARFIDVDDYDDDQINGAIVIASADFISINYDFKGAALTTTQGMTLPTDEVVINKDIKNATFQAALLHLKNRLFVDTTEININGAVSSESKSVGSLSKSVEYAENGRKYTNKYPTANIDSMLSAYVSGGGVAPSRALRY